MAKRASDVVAAKPRGRVTCRPDRGGVGRRLLHRPRDGAERDIAGALLLLADTLLAPRDRQESVGGLWRDLAADGFLDPPAARRERAKDTVLRVGPGVAARLSGRCPAGIDEIPRDGDEIGAHCALLAASRSWYSARMCRGHAQEG